MKKNKNKIISIVISALMTFVLICGNLVSASESEEKIYTYDELLAMSDEEFLALEYFCPLNSNTYSAKKMFDLAKKRYEINLGIAEGNPNNYDLWDSLGLNYYFLYSLDEEYSSEMVYKANITEQKIKYLLGDSIKYELNSPILAGATPEESYPPSLFYVFDNIISIESPEMNVNVYSTEGTSITYRGYDLTDKEVIDLAKYWYCINQVLPGISNKDTAVAVLDSGEQTTIEKGDVNIDKSVDLYDAVWIGKSLAGVYEFTDAQNTIGDMNSDEKCDFYDLILVARTLIS